LSSRAEIFEIARRDAVISAFTLLLLFGCIGEMKGHIIEEILYPHVHNEVIMRVANSMANANGQN